MVGHELGARHRDRLARAGAAATALYVGALATLALWVVVPVAALRWDATAVSSGSMEPSIRSGDVVLYEPYAGGELAAGEVVVFEDPARPDRLVMHRIVEVLAGGAYRTKGDANGSADRLAVTADAVRGTGRLVVPMAALPVVWAGSGDVLPLAVLVLVTAACVARPARRARRRRRLHAARRRPSAAPVAVALVLAASVVGLGATGSAAAFAATSVNPGNSLAAGTLPAPTGVTATAGCNGLTRKIDVSWTAAADATGYSVLRSTTSGGPYTQRGTTTGTTYTDTGLTGGTTYHYVVRSTLSSWTSADSAQASATAQLICV